MKRGAVFLVALAIASLYAISPLPSSTPSATRKGPAPQSWTQFLQHLPVRQSLVLDYRGRPVAHQSKAVGILPYDVGTRDLQQCADALMRLRAEYLFSQGRWGEIAFRFVSGDRFRYSDYLAGWRPRSSGRLVPGAAPPGAVSHASLRSYLDIVYTYASTLSLHRDLLPAPSFAIGTVIITPGSPGHCSMIVDERTDANGGKRYKLVESFMPAQSIYVLRNKEDGSPWHRLQGGVIETASYQFKRYDLRRWE